jgi:hypothetical protein
MPKFTEGEWHYCDGGIFTDKHSLPEEELCIAQIERCGINWPHTKTGLANARLMAQSKKMYEQVLTKLDSWWHLPNVERTIENIEPIMRDTLDILSSIEEK